MKENEKIIKAPIVDENAKLTKSKICLFSLQHLLAMSASTILVAVLTGLPIDVTILSSGIGTLFYIFITKGRSPLYLGSSFAFIAPISSALALGATLSETGQILSNPNYGAVMGGIIMVGAVYCLVGLMIKFLGTNWLTKLLPARVIGPVILVIGLGLAGTAVTMAKTNTPIALITLAIVILVSVYMKGVLQLLPVLIAIVAGYTIALFAGIVDFAPVMQASWFALPDFAFLKAVPEFNFSIAAIMIPVTFAVLPEHIGDHTVASTLIGRDLLKDPGLSRTIIGDGVATMVAGLLGGPVNTTYGENIGVMTLTKVASSKLTAGAAILAVVLSFFGKFIALIASIPTAVMGGVSVLLFGSIAASGAMMLVNNKIDLGDRVNLSVVAVVLIFGIGNFTIPLGSVTLSGMAVAAIAGIVVDQGIRLVGYILQKLKGKKAIEDTKDIV
ncbi:MAG: solute carrier family 23 protein [Clostridia bacterium]